MSHFHPMAVSRRHFLLGTGALAGGVALGGCGGDDDAPDDAGPAADELVLLSYLQGPLFAAGHVSRVPFGVADSNGLLRAEDTPAEVEVTVVGPDGGVAVGPTPVARHVQGLARAYFPLEVTLDEPGFYAARADLGGPAEVEMAFEVKRPDEITVPKPGDVFPDVTTASLADPIGVDPLCTDEPACAYHAATAAEVRASGRPMALLVATPKFCKTAACGPVYQVFLDTMAGHADVAGIHVEVYEHPEVNQTDLAPTLAELNLFLEPCLFLVGSDGTVAARFDAIFDEAELDQALSALS